MPAKFLTILTIPTFNLTIDKQLPNFARTSSGEFLYGEAIYAFPACLCSHIIRCESDAAEYIK